MSGIGTAKAMEKPTPQLPPVSVIPSSSELPLSSEKQARGIFRAAWYGINILLVLSFAAALYAVGWEYATVRYLKGFSDAIIPVSASPIGKVQAILDWMAHGPARRSPMPETMADDRDPTDTLNYSALLEVCGTATNAFMNLANTGGIPVRRLLLLDQDRLTVHVVAEVRIDGQWIVVDPAFRSIFRGPGGGLLTRDELKNPATLAFATKNLPDYLPSYTFDRAVHVRLARAGSEGLFLRRLLNRIAPGWEGSVTLSLITERASMAMIVICVPIVAFLLLLRGLTRWYGEARLGIRPVLFRERIKRASRALVDTSTEQAA